MRARPVSCCFSGHRPSKLPWGENEDDPRCRALKVRLRDALDAAYEAGYRHFICGMAQGCDLYFCELALALRQRHGDVSVEAAIPCPTQADGWPRAQQERYRRLVAACDYETLVQSSYSPGCMQRRNRYMVDHAALLLAVGIDPKNHVLFVQSHVPAHTQLSWVLACNTQFGELSRMTQFKDKSAKHPDNVNGGLFTYPVLMAADILIYNADLVPVGQDQTQHLEIARDIAGRFNGIYGDTFTLPEGYVPASGAKIMSLAEPTKKMSKSDTNVNSFILMTDDKDTIVRKFKRAVTDSDGVVRFDREAKPGVSNLMCIYSTFTGKSNDEIAAEFEGKGYGDFKMAVAEVTADALAPVQAEYDKILADKAYVDGVLKDGAERAARLANRTVSKVYRKVGLLQLDK